MNKTILKSMYIKSLKGLKEAHISFSPSLTAIMGVNGVGKTTVIHALACSFQPEDDKGENHKFPEFFTPNTDATWSGSEFSISYEESTSKEEKNETITKTYGKTYDRWTPKYDRRPKRPVYYIGIDTCLPEIEKQTVNSKIQYNSREQNDKISKKTIDKAAIILNKNYDLKIDNEYHNKHMIGVKMKSGLKYSSLSMGTGEQRTLKILETVYKAEQYSLILIDELDLLLHVSAFKKMIDALYSIAKERNLQIVFTTHSLEVSNYTEKICVQYIDYVQSGTDGRNIVYNRITSDLISHITGEIVQPIRVFVEDCVAEAIVSVLVKSLNMSSKVSIIKMGSIENAFTVAAGEVLSGRDITNTLVILDGDKYKTIGDKQHQIRASLTGTEADANEKRQKAVSMITEFNLPQSYSPEEYLKHIYLKCGKNDTELYLALQSIQAVCNKHDWIGQAAHSLNRATTDVVKDIISEVFNSEECEAYLASIKEWLVQRKDV